MINWKNELDNLKKLIQDEKLSYEEIGRTYGCSGANIRKQAKKLGIALSPRRSINPKETFNLGKKTSSRKCSGCGKEISNDNESGLCIDCYREFKFNENYKKNSYRGDPSIMRANYSPGYFRKFILNDQNGVCAICGKVGTNWNGKPLTLIVDHINGRASDNRRENLRCICPNCNSQLDTFTSKNKWSDRNQYRYGGYVRDNKNTENKTTDNTIIENSGLMSWCLGKMKP